MQLIDCRDAVAQQTDSQSVKTLLAVNVQPIAIRFKIRIGCIYIIPFVKGCQLFPCQQLDDDMIKFIIADNRQIQTFQISDLSDDRNTVADQMNIGTIVKLGIIKNIV
ncbi:hypothetical protein SDC9_203707 [bioreactor metagenome]|uniref:Uncharacterized protein n=1 Tax=bioreactor metagenome TaxID=1076179 RepID=A0A645IYT7_9ZZZZ